MTPLWERDELHWHPQALPEADEAALRDLQAGILRHHGRDHALAVYVRFLPTLNTTEGDAGRAWLRRIQPYVTSAWDELKAWGDRFYGPETGAYQPPGPLAVVALSAAGLRKVGRHPGADDPVRRVFNDQLKARRAVLGDEPDTWQAPFDQGMDGLAVLAADTRAGVDGLFRSIFGARPDRGARVVGVDELSLMWNAQGQPIEHFGFVDGRSQPRYLTFERWLDGESNAERLWSSAESLRTVLVPDWLSDRGGAGSYLVLRKLEQRVREFKKAEATLADGLGHDRAARDAGVAGALLVGRDRFGRPAGAAADDPVVPVDNGFLHADACPAAAHIKLMNPRDPYGQRVPMLARRGMSYGRRIIHPDDARTLDDYPEGGVGLLFMANVSHFDLFEALQVRANGHDGPVDPIAGQRATLPTQAWTDPATGAVANEPIGGFVRMLGGEYLYMPSRSGLASI